MRFPLSISVAAGVAATTSFPRRPLTQCSTPRPRPAASSAQPTSALLGARGERAAAVAALVPARRRLLVRRLQDHPFGLRRAVVRGRGRVGGGAGRGVVAALVR